jgi:hypothetical protein
MGMSLTLFAEMYTLTIAKPNNAPPTIIPIQWTLAYAPVKAMMNSEIGRTLTWSIPNTTQSMPKTYMAPNIIGYNLDSGDPGLRAYSRSWIGIRTKAPRMPTYTVSSYPGFSCTQGDKLVTHDNRNKGNSSHTSIPTSNLLKSDRESEKCSVK